jgi:hypothetical protein
MYLTPSQTVSSVQTPTSTLENEQEMSGNLTTSIKTKPLKDVKIVFEKHITLSH